MAQSEKFEFTQSYLARLASLPKARSEQAHSAMENGVACPLGSVVGCHGVRCGVEQIVIRPDSDPSSIVNLCTDQYTLCPTLRRHWHERQTAKEYAEEMKATISTQEDKDNEVFERFGRSV